MRKAFPVVLMAIGLLFLAAGGYTINRGLEARTLVRDELHAQKIVTPKDASIPNTRVHDAATAQAMADVIGKHTAEITGGRTYSELGRFVAIDGGDTNDEAEAVRGADGRPVANPLRNTAFQASSLRTSLYTSVLAFNVADLVVAMGALVLLLGVTVGGVGVALAGLAIPIVGRTLHVRPVAAEA